VFLLKVPVVKFVQLVGLLEYVGIVHDRCEVDFHVALEREEVTSELGDLAGRDHHQHLDCLLLLRVGHVLVHLGEDVFILILELLVETVK